MDPFIGEIRPFAGDFAPRGWAFCNGQLMPISQNTALFSLLRTVYGGDGRTTFALPDLQGMTPMHQGNGPGLTARSLGETGGSEGITLIDTEIPSHNHLAQCFNGPSNTDEPSQVVWANTGRGVPIAYNNEPNQTFMSSQAIHPVGGDQPHNNRQPYTGLNFIIALEGVFPPRS